jgi:hypothetical protein
VTQDVTNLDRVDIPAQEIGGQRMAKEVLMDLPINLSLPAEQAQKVLNAGLANGRVVA